ncbi:MAG: hypothetical protein ACFB10_10520 [Salibacteraceae bacterium]
MDEQITLTDFYSNSIYWLNPFHFFTILGELADYAYYSIAGVPIEGAIAYTVWAIELGIILIIPLFQLGLKRIPPFSEEAGKWYDRFKLEPEFQFIPGSESFKQEIREQGPAILETLDKGRPQRYSKVNLFYLPAIKENYMVFENLDYVPSQNRKKSSWGSDFVAISPEEAQQLLAEYHGKKSSWLDF